MVKTAETRAEDIYYWSDDSYFLLDGTSRLLSAYYVSY